jgi:ParB family chromosome partitioning protein
MAKKSGLGKGLSAILGDVESAYKEDIASNRVEVVELPLSRIKPNPFQPRKHFDDEALAELSNSILRHGVLQPIVAIKSDDGYIVIAGERRVRASKLAGLESIKAIVADIESEKLREVALIENIQREDLNPIELAESYKELIEQYNITQEELSSIVLKSRSAITNSLRLLKLSDYTKEKIVEGKISQGHAKILIGMDEKSERLMVDTIIGQKLSVRDTEELIKRFKNNIERGVTKSSIQKEVKNLDLSSAVKALEREGFRVKGRSNRLTLEFKNEDEMERFLNLISK